MRHYYEEIYNRIDIDEILDEVKATLNPLQTYLELARKTLSAKRIKAKWRKVEELRRAQLSLQGSICEVPKRIVVRSEAFQGIRVGEALPTLGYYIRIEEKLEDNLAVLSLEPTEWIFDSARNLHSFELVHNTPTGTILESGDKYDIVYYPKGKTPEGKKLPSEKYLSLLDISRLISEDGSVYDITICENGFITLTEELEKFLDKTLITPEHEVKFLLEEERKKGRNTGRWIQLLEIEEDLIDTESIGLSPLRYFFDDDISIEDDKGNKYTIQQSNEEELQLCLKYNGKDSYPIGATLEVKVNIHQLNKQKEAVLKLKETPHLEHQSLLKILFPRNWRCWEEFEPEYVKDWYVLTDGNRPGANEQRSFVCKAVATPDFALMAGPPGSGKTTVILELICQLIAKGKRILLCGSTHVAIDNVLERIDQRGLAKRVGIQPLRIGDTQRISEQVKHYQIDERTKDIPEILHPLIYSSANLVCGTTIGILRNPEFQSEKDAPITPLYDYLIIDESSKTTLQEFLVPALYAKHWILVGDVMQLSPFTEREFVETSIRNLCPGKSKEPISVSEQQALYLLYYLGNLRQSQSNLKADAQCIIPVDAQVINTIYRELRYTTQDEKKPCPADRLMKQIRSLLLVGRGTKEDLWHKQISYRCNTEITPLEMTAHYWIMIDRQLMDTLELPETHIILWQSSKDWKVWKESKHAFRFLAQGYHIENFLRAITSKDLYESIEETCNALYSREWAGEIAWRIDREHQQRLIKDNKKKGYTEQIAELMPFENRGQWISGVNRIATMAFPSVLEALERGIVHQGKKDSGELGMSSTLAQGFDPEALKRRREILIYQHRMHPEISLFPRTQFYADDLALQDNQQTEAERSWGYNIYPRRCYWKDIQGSTYRGVNKDEVDAVIAELNSFIEYTESHPRDDHQPWSVACLTFYRGQERELRNRLQNLTGSKQHTHFFWKGVEITLCTVDRFQGQEADLVLLSMVQTQRVGFMDSPNRLNVAVTRARFQNIIIGSLNYFKNQKQSQELRLLAHYASTGKLEVPNSNKRESRNNNRNYNQRNRQ